MLIQQTRLIRTATRNVDDTITFHNPPLQVARFPGIVRSLEATLNALTPVPDANQWGGYALVYDPLFTYTLYIRGTNPSYANALIMTVDVWETEADRLANPTNPQHRNNFDTDVIRASLPAGQLRTAVRAKVEATIVRYAVAGTMYFDAPPVVGTADPTGVLNKANPLDNTTVTVNRRDDTAPELPNPEAP